MAGGWRILDLCAAERATLCAERGAIEITSGERTDLVPAADVAVILLGTGVTFTSGVLHRLAEHDVVVMMCDWRGVPYSVATPWSDHSRIGRRQLAQASADPALLAEVWARLVTAKVRGQAAVLRAVRPRFAGPLDELAERVQPGDTTQVEAQAAQHYWQRAFGRKFRRDVGGADRINGLLNYGYGIVRAHGVRAVLSAGLVPALGVWHSHRANAFNLVADLMEPFRPAVDAAVLALPPYSSLRKVETKKLLAAVLTTPFGASGTTVSAAFTALASGFGRCLDEHAAAPGAVQLRVEHWTGVARASDTTAEGPHPGERSDGEQQVGGQAPREQSDGVQPVGERPDREHLPRAQPDGEQPDGG